MVIQSHQEDDALAAASGLVVVYGYSDDNVEFRGAIDDEVGAFDGTEIYVTAEGVLTPPECGCDGCEECSYFDAARKAAKRIEAVWGAGGVSWTFVTDIPHESFTILDDGDVFCVGIVFSISDL